MANNLKPIAPPEPEVTSTVVESRTDRYSKLLEAKALERALVVVVGVGAVGRQAAIQLASMGVGRIRIVDFDTVSVVNLGPQGWLEGDVGKAKVEALSSLLSQVNSSCKVEVANGKFEPAHLEGADYVLACVDNMEVRKEIVDAAANTLGVLLVVDSRMGLEINRTYHIFDAESRDAWAKTWFPQAEAHEAPCGMKATVYCASAAGALACTAVFKHMSGRSLPFSFELNMGAHMGMATWPELKPAEDEVPAH